MPTLRDSLNVRDVVAPCSAAAEQRRVLDGPAEAAAPVARADGGHPVPDRRRAGRAGTTGWPSRPASSPSNAPSDDGLALGGELLHPRLERRHHARPPRRGRRAPSPPRARRRRGTARCRTARGTRWMPTGIGARAARRAGRAPATSRGRPSRKPRRSRNRAPAATPSIERLRVVVTPSAVRCAAPAVHSALPIPCAAGMLEHARPSATACGSSVCARRHDREPDVVGEQLHASLAGHAGPARPAPRRDIAMLGKTSLRIASQRSTSASVSAARINGGSAGAR